MLVVRPLHAPGSLVARGKNAAKSQNRRASQAKATLAALQAELEAEEALLAEVSAEADAVERARHDLFLEGAARDREASPELEALRAESASLATAVAAQKAHEQACHEAWQKLTERIVDQLGGGREGLEAFVRLIGQTGFLVDGPVTDLGTAETVRLQKIRGLRNRLHEETFSVENSAAEALRGAVRRRLFSPREAAGIPEGVIDRDTATPEQVSAYEKVEEAAEHLLAQRVSAQAADSLHTWHPLPIFAGAPYDRTELLQDLGAIEDVDAPEIATGFADEWPAPTGAMSATVRNRLAASNVDTLTERWHDRLAAGEILNRVLGKHHGPFHSGPLHPRPGRAASLRHLYSKSALGTWSRAEENNGPTRLWGLMSVALTCATSFWMPAGQTWAFADSDPLSDEDRADLLLPFPQVFMAFAEPLEIGPTLPATVEQAAVLRDFDSTVTSLRDHSEDPTLRDLLFSPGCADHLGELSVAEVLDIRGGSVEGVLLLADSLGRLDDTFAWCLSLPSGLAGSMGRHIIPASLTGTLHRALVENLVAVASWADWHDPDASTALPTGLSRDEVLDLTGSASFRRDADRSGAGGVRVLNVRSSVKPSEASGSTGRHVVPHVRRGHWRRQRYGPGRGEVRRIRIAPLIVNAHRGPVGHRVYVVPRGRPLRSKTWGQ